MAGQQGQPKYGFGWPDGRLGGLGSPGQREARPLHNQGSKNYRSTLVITVARKLPMNISVPVRPAEYGEISRSRR